MSNYAHIFEPIRIGNTIFKNRIWSAPANVHLLYDQRPYPTEAVIQYYAKKAAGGAACITYSAQNMDFERPFVPSADNENILLPYTHRFFSQLTSSVHSAGGKISLEMLAFHYHMKDENGELIEYTVNGGVNKRGYQTKELTKEIMHKIAKSYGETASAALKCGFDMVLIHAGHGLVLSEMMSPTMNRRKDEFGGCLENRMRFLNTLN